MYMYHCMYLYSVGFFSSCVKDLNLIKGNSFHFVSHAFSQVIVWYPMTLIVTLVIVWAPVMTHEELKCGGFELGV